MLQRYHQAATFLKQAAQLWDRQGRPDLQIQSLERLGGVHFQMANYETATVAFQDALRMTNQSSTKTADRLQGKIDQCWSLLQGRGGTHDIVDASEDVEQVVAAPLSGFEYPAPANPAGRPFGKSPRLSDLPQSDSDTDDEAGKYIGPRSVEPMRAAPLLTPAQHDSNLARNNRAPLVSYLQAADQAQNISRPSPSPHQRARNPHSHACVVQ